MEGCDQPETGLRRETHEDVEFACEEVKVGDSNVMILDEPPHDALDAVTASMVARPLRNGTCRHSVVTDAGIDDLLTAASCRNARKEAVRSEPQDRAIRAGIYQRMREALGRYGDTTVATPVPGCDNEWCERVIICQANWRKCDEVRRKADSQP